MKQKSEFRQQEEHESQVHSESQEKGREFSSVEELLRYDAEQQSPSPNLAERVKQSIGCEPDKESWWRRLAARLRFGGRRP